MSNGRSPGPRSPHEKLTEQLERAKTKRGKLAAQLALADDEVARLETAVAEASDKIPGEGTVPAEHVVAKVGR